MADLLRVALSIIQRVSADIQCYGDGRGLHEDTVESYILSLEFVFRELIALDTIGVTSYELTQAMENVRSCLISLRDYNERRALNIHTVHQNYGCRIVHRGLVGRPSIEISYEQLSFLVESNFTSIQISNMLGVSLRTIQRRLSEFGISIRMTYSSISDDELDELVAQIQMQFPMCGNRLMQGHLLSKGYRVQQKRVRESQRRIDPEGTIIRHLHVLNRREYRVPAPRSLYHIDSHHKLIRYCKYMYLI